jgi:hypothetical protein
MNNQTMYRLPNEMNVILNKKKEKGELGKFITQAIWEALKKEEAPVAKDSFSEDFLSVEDFILNER